MPTTPASAKPRVTIVTVTCNQGHFIEQCIDSVLAQTFTEWEQIIIDDRSDDGTPDIVARYDDPRISYIYLPEKHGPERLKDSYNRALREGRGEFTAYLEADDYWAPDALESLVAAFDNDDVVLAWARGMQVTIDGDPIRVYYNRGFRASDDAATFRNQPPGRVLNELLRGDFIPGLTTLIRTSALEAIGGFRQFGGYRAVDYPTWLSLALIGEFRPVDAVTGFRRRHSTSTYTKLFAGGAEPVDLASYFYEHELPESVRSRLRITPAELRKSSARARADWHYYRGRLALLKKDWTSARREFLSAYRSGSLPRRVKAALGWVAGVARWDLRVLERIPGRGSFTRIHTTH